MSDIIFCIVVLLLAVLMISIFIACLPFFVIISVIIGILSFFGVILEKISDK